MQRTEYGPVGPDLLWRLREEIDRLLPPETPPWVEPASNSRNRRWQPIAVGLALVIIGILSLGAAFLTDSGNPGVWTERAGEAIQAAVRVPQASPSPATSASPSQSPPQAATGALPPSGSPTQASAAPPASGSPTPSAPSARGKSPHPTASPQPSPTPEPSESPETSPTPEPSESPEPSPTPPPGASPQTPASPQTGESRERLLAPEQNEAPVLSPSFGQRPGGTRFYTLKGASFAPPGPKAKR
jgi:hypothetical protein